MRDPVGQGITLREGDTNLHSVACGGGSVWCGCSTSPSRLVRVSPELLDYETIVMHGTGGLHDLCWDGEALWCAHSSGHLSRLDPSDGSVQTIPLRFSGASAPFTYACRYDGRDIWIGMYTDPGSVLRVDRHSGKIREYRVPEAPMWSIRDVAFAGGRVWVPVYGAPGRVVGVNPDSGDRQVVQLGAEEILPSTLVARDDRVWAGLDTMPARAVEIDACKCTVLRCVAFGEQSSSCRAMTVASGSLWVALYTDPAQIVRMDPDSGEWEEIDLPEGYANSRAMADDGEFLFIGLQNRRHLPSALFRLPLGPRGERRDTDEKVRITAQDWYRVRRGEDQLAWGHLAWLEHLPKVVFSRRAGEELAFLDPTDREGVVVSLQGMSSRGPRGDGAAVEGGGGWLHQASGDLRIIYRRRGSGDTVEVATIRKAEGVSFDPENMGHPPGVEGLTYS